MCEAQTMISADACEFRVVGAIARNNVICEMSGHHEVFPVFEYATVQCYLQKGTHSTAGDRAMEVIASDFNKMFYWVSNITCNLLCAQMRCHQMTAHN